MSPPHQRTSEEIADELGLSWTIANPTLVTYRSVGIGGFGAVMRYAGMPLEKIALYMNSAQVTGKGQFGQAVRLTFAQGALAPYRVVGPSSLTAWFLQYSVMGVAFQFFDHSISAALGVEPVYYGPALMEAPTAQEQATPSADYQARSATARILSPVLASCLESFVSNRAEVQRFFGPEQYAKLQQGGKWRPNLFTRLAGPAFLPNTTRNVIMCQTTFLLTPITYKLYFPQEHKSVSSMFWYGLGVNMFFGNVVAITQQAFWGRSLDYLRQHGRMDYMATIRHGLREDGLAAFFTVPKWFSRVLMNAPAQGTLPWFYNELLPMGEPAVLQAVRALLPTPQEEASEHLLRMRRRTTPVSSPTTTANGSTEEDTSKPSSGTFAASSPR